MRIKTYDLFLLLFLLLNSRVVSSQDLNKKESSSKFNYSTGACAGFTTGYGLSFRYLPTRLGIQVNFAPFHSKEIDQYSFGMTLLYKLIENDKSNLFLYEGNHYYYRAEPEYNFYYQKPIANVRRVKKYFNNGMGIGIELMLIQSVGFNLMGGYAAYNNFEESNFTAETGLYYKF